MVSLLLQQRAGRRGVMTPPSRARLATTEPKYLARSAPNTAISKLGAKDKMVRKGDPHADPSRIPHRRDDP